jgi:hypothetical protein
MSQQINLFSTALRKQTDHFSLLAMSQALGLIILGSLLFFGYAMYQVQQLTLQVAESQKRFEAEQEKFNRYSADFSPQLAQQLLENELKQAEIEAKTLRELILRMKSGGLGNTKGYSEYMRAFARQTMSGLWLTGFDITGDAVQMTLRGAALAPESVPGFINRLSQEKIMRGKEFAALQMQQHKFEAGKPAGRAYLDFTLQSADVVGEKK